MPIQTLPTWLQPFAEWNPISTLTNSLRDLWGNPNPSTSTSLPTTEPILVTLVWVVVFIAVFVPLGVRKFRSTEPLSRRAAEPPSCRAAGAEPGRAWTRCRGHAGASGRRAMPSVRAPSPAPEDPEMVDRRPSP